MKFKKIFILFFLIFGLEESKSETNGFSSAKSLVEQFQSIPTQDMFCVAPDWSDNLLHPSYSDLLKKLKSQFSYFYTQEFYKLFMWAQCRIPEFPPMKINQRAYMLGLENSNFYRDFRFGTQDRGGEECLKNIHVNQPVRLAANKLKIRVNFFCGEALHTDYILLQENGIWKIDDIAPKKVDLHGETVHWGSRSLKKDLKIVFRVSNESLTSK